MRDHKININVDMGEGVGNESELMPYISSCNIACGGHAGDIDTMRSIIKLAKQYDVKIGAHPAFPDRENFGRVPMELPAIVLYKSIKKQVRDLLVVLKEEHARLYHIKPHGALYNLAAIDRKIANIIIEVIKSMALPIKLYAPYNSVIAEIAKENNIAIKYEAFADRNYNEDLTLVSRNKDHALITDSDILFDHVYRMYHTQKVKTVTGVEKHIHVDTFCVHGDNTEAVHLIKDLSTRLKDKGVTIA